MTSKSTGQLHPDWAEASKFLDLLSSQEDKFVFCAYHPGDNTKYKPIQKYCTLEEAIPKLERLNLKGYGIYVCINETNGTTKDRDVTRVRAIFQEDDGAGTELPLAPNLVVNTSPDKYHRYYFLADTLPLDKFTPIQRRLVQDYGSDESVINLGRVLRLPGSLHTKGEPYLVTITDEPEDFPYTSEELLEAFPPVGSKALSPLQNADPIIEALKEKELYIAADDREPGKHYIVCPWKNGHSEGIHSPKEAAVWQANTGGFKQANFKCMHSSCAEHYMSDLLELLEIDLVADEFDRIDKDYNERLEACEEEAEVMAIIAEIKDSDLSLDAVRVLSHRVKRCLNRLSDDRYDIGVVRNMLTPDRTGIARRKPKWANPWVYVAHTNTFFNTDTYQVRTRAAFNAEMTKHVLPNENGNRQWSADYLTENGYVEVVESIQYAPSVEDKIFEFEGSGGRVVNSFDPYSVPVANEEYINKPAVRLVKAHIERLLGDEHSGIMIDWLAYQVQHIGKPIGWAPIIIGPQGIGKTYIERLLATVIGNKNVGTVSSVNVCSNFNAWAHGKAVLSLNELKIGGHNRHEVVNQLKPLITDKVIDINGKGVATYNVINTTNYIAFSNYLDAIPLDADDRRWWVVFAEGNTDPDYFEPLWEALQYPGDLRRWLERHKISDEILTTKIAPESSDKGRMIATEEANFEGLAEAKELLKTGGLGYCQECFSSVLFGTAIEDELGMVMEKLKGHHKNAIFKKLGYTQTGTPVKWNGKTHRVWVAKTMTNLAIRKKLDETL